MRKDFLASTVQVKTELSIKEKLKRIKNNMKYKIKNMNTTPNSRLGAFRLGGEVHMWMYDKYSLSRLLKKEGFEECKIKNSFESDIPSWGDYELDVKDGNDLDQISLFIEAKKPANNI